MIQIPIRAPSTLRNGSCVLKNMHKNQQNAVKDFFVYCTLLTEATTYFDETILFNNLEKAK